MGIRGSRWTYRQMPVSPRREYLLLYPYIMPYGIREEMRVFTEQYSIYGEDINSYIRK